MLSFELGAPAAWATAVISVVVIGRAAMIGVSATDAGVIIRNQWRTFRIHSSEIERVFSKTVMNMQFAYIARRDGGRAVRIWSSYARPGRDELLEVLRHRAKGRGDLSSEDFHRNDSVVSLWKEARKRANLDPSSVAASRRMLLRHLAARIPLVLGASVLAGARVAVVTLMAVTLTVCLLTLTVRGDRASSPEARDEG